jgi:hypothetical protein
VRNSFGRRFTRLVRLRDQAGTVVIRWIVSNQARWS